eukprot:g22052.t1
MIWQSLFLAVVFAQTTAPTSSTCPTDWKAAVGQTCTGTPVCQYDPFCCCPEEQLEANKMCVMVNNLSCKSGKWVHKETTPPPPCIMYPDFKCPSCKNCPAQAPTCTNCVAPNYCQITEETCDTCPQATCKPPPTCTNVVCQALQCVGNMVAFTPPGQCCAVECRPKECSANSDCPATSFCDKPPGACQEKGLCSDRPAAADCARLDPQPFPVCGCDGKTQQGFCLANAAGINVFDFGACKTGTTAPTSVNVDHESSSSWDSSWSTSFDGSESEPLTVPELPVVLPLGPKPQPCHYRLDCQGIVCPAACGGGVGKITCPVVNFKPAINGGNCDAVEGGTMTVDCVNGQECPATSTAAVACYWDRFCGTDDMTWLYPCVADCGGGAGYRECEVRNFMPAKNGGTCKKSRNSELILRSCTNTDPCPVDCSFELECEEVCNGKCGTEGWKKCKVKNFVKANEVGRCNLPATAQVEGAEVMESCATQSCAETCPKSMRDYFKHNNTDYATCKGERTCKYNEFCCCPDEKLQEDKGCQHVNHLTCQAGKWIATQSQPPSCVADPDKFVCPSEPGGKYCVRCPKELPECDASCKYPSYCKYQEANCTSCPKATCIPPPNCSATTCPAGLMKLGAACKSDNEHVLAPNGECCGMCVAKKCSSDDECAGFCARQPGDCEGKGVCQPVPNPMSCMLEDAHPQPVCGCDGQTYQGWCMANSAMTNLKLLSTCPKVAPTTATGIKLTWMEDIYPKLLTLDLHEGHGKGGAAAQMLSMSDVLESFKNVVRVKSKEVGAMDLIKPCDAAGSYLYLKMAGAHGILGSIMPPEGSASQDFLALMATWINEGALYDKTSTATTCKKTETVARNVAPAPAGKCPESMIDWRKHKTDKYAVCSGNLTCSYDKFCCCPDEVEEANRECVDANTLKCVNGKWEYHMAEPAACIKSPAFMCATKKAKYAVGIPNSELCPADLASWEASATKRSKEGIPLVPCTQQGLQCRYDEFCCCPDEALDANKECMMSNNLFCVNGFWQYQASPPPPCYADPNFKCAADAACVTCAADEDPSLLPECNASCVAPNYCKYEDRTCEQCQKATCTEPPVCDAVICAVVTCEAMYEPVVQNGECCPVCQAKSCEVSSECGKGNFCSKEPGDCDGKGTCTPIPNAAVCRADNPNPAPVCGCDGENHKGMCMAAAVGVSVADLGLCTVVGVSVAGEISVAGAPGSMHFWTDHAFRKPLPVAELSYPVTEVKEWKFHVYWHAKNPNAMAEADLLLQKLIKTVCDGKFVAVSPGVTSQCVPGLMDDTVPKVMLQPVGPHPHASYEVWAPRESFADVMGFFVMNRGSLSVFVHPITRFQLEDYVGRSWFLGRESALDLSQLQVELPIVPKQYPELGLGYSAVAVVDKTSSE